MRVLVNGLSANHPSAKHVLYGHLRQLADWTRGEHNFTVLISPESDWQQQHFPDNVAPLVAPQRTRKTLWRSLWEQNEIPKLIRRNSVDLYFTPAGTTLRRCSVPQVSLAQNPWCMVSAVPKKATQRLVASIQRKAYARAQVSADLMAYNSAYMRDLYQANAGTAPRRSSVVYQAIDESTHVASRQLREQVDRKSDTIVAVSVMACWKGVDQLVRALAQLHQLGIQANLRLVGPWPSASYEREVRDLIGQSNLEDSVTITGKVSRGDLHREMASARLFALPSRCESFGIPAVEAQAFGTPVIGSSTTAMAEIGGEGGEYCDPDDLQALTNLLSRQITDSAHWQRLSEAARANAAKYHWQQCSKPLLKMFELV